MCEVILAKNAGFCPGVRAATERLRRRIESRSPNERIFTLGHLIHNEDYIRSLADQGVIAVSNSDLEPLAATATPTSPVTVFIRAHGITCDTRALLERLATENPHFSFVDCTCVFVR